MRAHAAAWWENVRTSLWFVPSLMALMAIGLSFFTVHLDQQVKSDWVHTVGWIWAGGVEGARAVLSTIAGSTITVAGVTFSITITALVLASSQFGPRLLRNFMGDRGNQFVLGTFIATYLYCLLVLRTVRSVDESRFVPYISVTVGMLLAILSLGVLIYFIHHVAGSIQADNLAASVARELRESIDRLFPQEIGEPIEPQDFADQIPSDFDDQARAVEAPHGGYVQSIDSETLMNLACEHDFLVRLKRRPGEFVACGNSLLEVWPPDKCDQALAEKLDKIFVIGSHRSATQDAEYSVDQLVEVACRALSPGINDPRTAITCIDWLGEAVGQLAEREMPAHFRRDEGGKLRVIIASPVTFEVFVDAAWSQIRRYGATSVDVTLHLLSSISEVAAHLRRETDRATLRRHADLVAEDGQRQTENSADRAAIIERHHEVLQALMRAKI